MTIERSDVESTPALPTVLGMGAPHNALPDAPQTYLLLNTFVLEDWAYRPSPADAAEATPWAPGVEDLVRSVSPLTLRRWLWDNPALGRDPERGPLLVDATGDAPLIEHALTQRAPVNGAVLIGADTTMDALHAHLASLVRVIMPDTGLATFDFLPSQLAAWLCALDTDHRLAWLGPMTDLLWYSQRGPVHHWYRVRQEAAGPAQRHLGWLHLRDREWAAFDHNVREHFVAGIAYELVAMPAYATLSQAQARQQVREALVEAGRLYIRADADFRRYFFLMARHPALRHDPRAQELLREPDQPPEWRLRGVEALVDQQDSSQ